MVNGAAMGEPEAMGEEPERRPPQPARTGPETNEAFQPLGDAAEEIEQIQDGKRVVVQVYRHLRAQDRWIGVAYDDRGGVIATASRGTRTKTCTALQKALDACSVGFVATVSEPAHRGAPASEGPAGRRQPSAATASATVGRTRADSRPGALQQDNMPRLRRGA